MFAMQMFSATDPKNKRMLGPISSYIFPCERSQLFLYIFSKEYLLLFSFF